MNKSTPEMKLLKYIGNFLTFIGTIFTILSFYGYSASGHNIVWLILGIFFVTVTLFVFIYKKNISKRVLVFVLNKTVSSQNIEIHDKVVKYEHIDRHKYRFQSTFSIKVVGNTPINSHEEKIKWTAGYISEIVPTKPHHKIEYDKNASAYNSIDKQIFKIVFPNDKQISKNDEAYKTGFKILNLVDENQTAKPILMVGVYNVTKNLTMKVYFAGSLNPIEIRGLKFAHFIDKEPYDSVPLELKYDEEADKNYVEFFIKSPIYGGKYVIDWNFSD